MTIHPNFSQQASARCKPSRAKQMSTFSILSQAILAASVATAGVAHASEYSSVTFFGDSLTDGGFFKPVTESLLIKNAGQFTTNPDPSWATPFAQSLGYEAVANTRTFTGEQTQNGNNYAIGGALAGDDTSQLGMRILSTKNQMNNYLDNKTVDPNGLYSVWVGANDIFGSDNNFNYDTPEAIRAIKAAAINEVEVIKTLSDKGAKYILVPNVPDLGSTPDAIDAESRPFFPNKQARQKSTAAAELYNKTLYDTLAAKGINVIPLDTFSLLKEATENAAAYGFTNVVDRACGKTSSLMCTEKNLQAAEHKNDYLFADGVHPTGRTHRMIADYANAVTTAPSQVSVLPHIATQSGLATTQRLQNHINQRQDITSQHSSSGPSVWASADISSLDVAGFDSSGNVQLLLGLDYDYPGSADAISGIYGHISQSKLDKEVRSGIKKVDFDEIGVGLYHSNKIGNVQLNGAVGYGKIDMDINRVVALDNTQQQFKSDADGKRYYATLQAGYPFQIGSFARLSQTSVTPYLAATANQVKLDAIKEKEMTGIAMQFDKQKYNTTYGTLGVKASSQLGDSTHIFGDVHYQKQLNDSRRQVTARLNTQPGMPFTTPTFDLDDDSFGVSLGVSHKFGALTANAGVSHATGDDDDMTSIFVGLSGKF